MLLCRGRKTDALKSKFALWSFFDFVILILLSMSHTSLCFSKTRYVHPKQIHLNSEQKKITLLQVTYHQASKFFLPLVIFHNFHTAVFDFTVFIHKILWQQGLTSYIVLFKTDLFGPKDTGNIVTDCFTSLGWDHKCASTILGLICARDPVERIMTITFPDSS